MEVTGNFKFVLICVFLAMLSTCSLRQGNISKIEEKAPAWVDGQSKDYPASDYFVGIGVSNICCGMEKKLVASKDAARAEIAKIFKVKIETASEEVLQRTLTGRGKYSSVETRESYQTFVKASTEMILEGVEIKDSYKNNRGEVYTLAVMSKNKAIELFSSKQAALKKGLQEQLQAAADAMSKSNSFNAIKYNRRALVSALQLELLNNQLIVAGGKGARFPAEYSPDFIRIKIDRLFSSIKIAIDGDEHKIRSAILETLSIMGLKVKTKLDSNSPYKIKYKFAAYDDGSIALSGDYVSYKSRADLAIEFFKPQDSKVVGKVNLEGKGVGKSTDLAQKAAIRDLTDVVRQELPEAMFKFL